MTNPLIDHCAPRAYLCNGGTLADLQEKFAISVKRHYQLPHLVHLKYSQIDSPMDNPIVQECRGLMLDQEDNWRIVAWPFSKFFNADEPLAAKIDWRSAKVQEKLDGSLMILYWYGGAWRVATSGMPDAMGMVHGTNRSFAQLFWETWHAMGFVEPPSINRCYTYMFELTSPLNRVVVSHPKATLTLIGMRSIWSGRELQISHQTSYNPVKQFPLQSIDDVRATFETMDPLQQEGYVAVDEYFRRVKVKHPGYEALHHLKSSFSIKRVVEIVRQGEETEVLTHFPEWKLPFEQVRAAYDALVTQLEQDYAELKDIGVRKDFALAAKLSPFPGAHFLMRDSKATSVRDVLKSVPHIDKMIDLLGVKGMVLEGAI